MKHGINERLKYMHMLEEGYSKKSISKHFGIDINLLKVLWRRYQHFGVEGLQKQPNVRADGAFREKVIRDIEENGLSLSEASYKYCVSCNRIRVWKRVFREKGVTGLYEIRYHGRPPIDMGRPKKKKPEEMTELERLKYENERLRAEKALLKKVRALVEEREARLREIGRKPSKN